MDEQTADRTIPDLAARRPDSGDPDDVLEAYLDWTLDLGIELYSAQEDAVLELMAGRHVVLATPTGSGKSLVAVAMHFRALSCDERSVYTAPIKALVSEKFFDLCRTFGADRVGMLTGDASINPDAPIVCCTQEVLANMALRDGRDTPFAHVVMDEFHFYADPDRGMAWQIPLLVMENATFLLMSATLGDTSEIEQSLRDRTGREVAAVTSVDRPVPLDFEYRLVPLHETIADLISKGRAPIYLVNFSQREASEQAQNLMSVDFTAKQDKKSIAAALKGFRFDSPYGKTIERYIRHGIGLHHAGLLPKYRLLVEKLAQQGLLKVVSGTDTLGVGVNVPIRTVLLTKLCKFDGERVRHLSVREFQQVSGRAGRKGFDDQGWVSVQAPEHVIENKRLAAKAKASGKKKVVKRKAPTKGFIPWDRTTFERLSSQPCEPLKSVFALDHGILLNLLQCEGDASGGGYRLLGRLIDASHESRAKKRQHRRQAAGLLRALRGAGIVELAPREGRRGKRFVVSDTLQEDFSLYHSLSLFAVDAVGLLDPEAEEFELDVLTLVESILEHPRPVLYGQISRAKGELIAQLKAEGVPYEERMEALDDVTYPKPRAEWVYATFDAFAETHPWVGAEAIRPKSVARDMIEQYLSFNEFVDEYGLQRMEGVVLRYMTQAYKTLLQVVPAYFKTEPVLDVEAYLRTTLARVDNSLLVEWEQMMEVPDDLQDQVQLPQRPKKDITHDAKAFMARVRSEMHQLVRALSEGDYEDACHYVRQADDDPWTPERFEGALVDFLSSYPRIVFDHRARLADKTLLRKTGHRVWEVTQVLVDPDEDNFWSIDGLIDLSGTDEVDDSPLVAVEKIGP